MRIFVILAVFLISLSVESQVRRNPNRPSIPQEPTEKEIERQKEKMEERLDEYLVNFLTTLEADEFQKVIIRQKLDSYFEEKRKIFAAQYERSLERVDAVKKLDENHFKELEGIVSEGDMDKIKELIEGNFDDKDVKKKKRKNKRKKSKN